MAKTPKAISAAVKACYEVQAKLDPFDTRNLRRDANAIFRCALEKTQTMANDPRAAQVELAVNKAVGASRSKRWNYDALEQQARRKLDRVGIVATPRRIQAEAAKMRKKRKALGRAPMTDKEWWAGVLARKRRK